MSHADKLYENPFCNVCANIAQKKRVYCLNCEQWCHKSCAQRKSCCNEKFLMCDYVINETETETRDIDRMFSEKLDAVVSTMQLKIENLHEEVKEIKILLTCKNATHDDMKCLQIDNKTTKTDDLNQKKKMMSVEMKTNESSADWQALPRIKCNQRDTSTLTELSNKQQQLMSDIINLELETDTLNTLKTTTRNRNGTTLNLENKVNATGKTQSDNRKQKPQNEFSRTPKTEKEKSETQENKFEEVRPRRSRKRNYKVGACESSPSETSSFIGTQRNKKIWLFIAGAREHVTETIVKQYINGKLQDSSQTEVKELKTFHKKIDNKCFFVGVEYLHKEAVYNPSFWPMGIRFSRFDFRKGEHFLDNPKETSTTKS
ncbi:hypothetical protein Zmor_000397 [Zophobas morio]|uniref:Uncharacterized protein n=1 Tax=Zophobas morio TaxID=2755281 RepID=A0AA38J4J6_9CUCU|nr:hypothetical protein Zmor_000397 [Zophobas morio]